jgi:hypothetical protein
VVKVPADNDQPPGEPLLREPPSEPILREPPGEPILREPPGEPILREPPGEPILREPPGEPILRVVRGDASPQEIAALVAVLLAARSAVDDAAPEPARSAWSDRSAVLRSPVFPGPGAWRGSALPH